MSVENDILSKLGTFVATRRSKWKFIVEDDLVRIITNQFVANWKIIQQIVKEFNVEIVDVTSHNTFGVIVCVRFNSGKQNPQN
jgi:hypothetical protein